MNKQIVLRADVSFSPSRQLRAGNISLRYEEGRIRYLTVGGSEIIRMIYPALRDENWGSVEHKISDERIEADDDSFRISYVATYAGGDVRYRAEFEIEGRADSSVRFHMEGEAHSLFKRARIGICALQPIDSCSGREVTVTQPDGQTYTGKFPTLVHPQQPLLHIRRMQWEAGGNVTVDALFEGDEFETEDQRNWSDNSYKTYGTPLSIPLPATVHPGDRVSQQITVRAEAHGERTFTGGSTASVPLPRVGYALTALQLSPEEVALVKALQPDHLALQLSMADDWKTRLAQAIDTSKKIEVSLLLSVLFHSLDDQEIESLSSTLSPIGEHVQGILVLAAAHATAPAEFFARAYARLKADYPSIAIGFGSREHFAELNASRAAGLTCDFLAFNLHPQVHLPDSRTIIENLESQPIIVETVQQFAAGRPVYVTPLTFSDGGAQDLRFRTDFAAWWTANALQRLSGVQAVTLFAATGEQGLVLNGTPTAIYDLLKTIRDGGYNQVKKTEDGVLLFENPQGVSLQIRSELPSVIS